MATINLNQAIRGVGNTDNIIGDTIVVSTQTGVAAAGSTSAAATVLSAIDTVVSTATGGSADGVRFTPTPAGMFRAVQNISGATLSVYPPTGGTIRNLAADAADTIASGVAHLYFATAANSLYRIKSA